MTIRNATIDDLAKVVELFDAYRTFYNKPLDSAGAKAFISERLNQKDSEIYVADINGSLAGFVQLYPLFSSTRMKKYWLLNDLFVAEEYRGKQISLALIERAKQLVEQTNACGMYLETGKENAIGNQLYPRAGFKAYDSVNFYEWEASNQSK